YLLTSMISAAATPTTEWVRRPAAFCFSSRSTPISADKTNARPSSSNWSRPWPPEMCSIDVTATPADGRGIWFPRALQDPEFHADVPAGGAGVGADLVGGFGE